MTSSVEITQGRTLADWATDRMLRAVIGVMRLLPYEKRVPAMGWFTRRFIAPLAGYNRRSALNLSYIFPDMDRAERAAIVAQVADNAGRTFIENYSPDEFLARNASASILGPGLAALKNAQASGKPVILVTGHFGNYEAPRAALVGLGYNVGGLYRPATNKFFNDHYAGTFTAYGGPIFAQGHRGTAGFVRHLKAGGILVLLFDQHVKAGKRMNFLGRPARTALSASELALRYGAELIPFYGTRQPDGLSFAIELEAPIPHSDPVTMTRAMNASLEARILANPSQWFWIHRRWKVGRMRKMLKNLG
ncbi:MAG: lysophospholipid acyltransferase family protein [Paracoccaceae bacterium]